MPRKSHSSPSRQCSGHDARFLRQPRSPSDKAAAFAASATRQCIGGKQWPGSLLIVVPSSLCATTLVTTQHAAQARDDGEQRVLCTAACHNGGSAGRGGGARLATPATRAGPLCAHPAWVFFGAAQSCGVPRLADGCIHGRHGHVGSVRQRAPVPRWCFCRLRAWCHRRTRPIVKLAGPPPWVPTTRTSARRCRRRARAPDCRARPPARPRSVTMRTDPRCTPHASTPPRPAPRLRGGLCVCQPGARVDCV